MECGTAHEFNLSRGEDKKQEETKEEPANQKGKKAKKPKKEVISAFGMKEAYKIEVAANRYDMLCLEGIAAALKCYLEIQSLPEYKIVTPAEPFKIIVKPETKSVRRYALGCILRNIKFTEQSYYSFIDLQDKLHQNICRRRTLGSMGTHDLDKI